MIKKLIYCLRNFWACLAEAWRMLRTDEAKLEEFAEKYGL